MLSEETDSLKETLAGLGIKLKPVMYKMDVRPLLRAVTDMFFGRASGLVDMMQQWIPCASDGAKAKVRFGFRSHA